MQNELMSVMTIRDFYALFPQRLQNENMIVRSCQSICPHVSHPKLQDRLWWNL